MTVRSTIIIDVRLDCGCVVTPPNGQQGLLVRCPGHGLRHALDLAEEVTTFVYTGKRLDPPDPEPEPAEDVLVVPGG